MHTYETSVADVAELWLKASTANKEAVNVRLLCEFLAVLGGNRASVDDTQRVRNILGHLLCGPFAYGSVNFLCLRTKWSGMEWSCTLFAYLLGSGDLACTDGPYGLVCHDNFAAHMSL